MTEYNRLHDLVLPKDVELAEKLYNCMVECFELMKLYRNKEEFEKWKYEVDRCSRDFDELLLRKKRSEEKSC